MGRAAIQQELIRCLGDLYIWMRCVTHPGTMGWASCRWRQFCVGIRRTWVRPVLMASGHVSSSDDDLIMDAKLKELFRLQASVDALGTRTCRFTYEAYFIANAEELDAEYQWAIARPTVHLPLEDDIHAKVFRILERPH